MLTQQGFIYERRVYFLLDLLGKAGGFAGAIEFLVIMVLHTFTMNYTETKFVDIFTNSLIDVDKNYS